MTKKLTLVESNGSFKTRELFLFSYLLILASLAYVAAMAINELVQAILEKYVKKDSLIGYFIYAILAISLVIFLVYLGCCWSPDFIQYVNLTRV